MATNWLRGKQTPEKGPRWADEAVNDSGPEAKRLAILTTAAKLFTERGYERVRLDDIADALNVTKPSLYYHVGNKEKILVEIRRLAAEQLLEGFELESDRSGAELLAQLLVRYGEFVTSDLGVCVIRLYKVKVSARGAKSLRDIERWYELKLKAIFEKGIKDGSLKRCDPALVSMAILGGLNWLAFWYDAERGRRSRSEISKLFVEVFLQGIEAKSSSSRAPLANLEARPPSQKGQ